jgi:hypothetical protein
MSNNAEDHQKWLRYCIPEILLSRWHPSFEVPYHSIHDGAFLKMTDWSVVTSLVDGIWAIGDGILGTVQSQVET